MSNNESHMKMDNSIRIAPADTMNTGESEAGSVYTGSGYSASMCDTMKSGNWVHRFVDSFKPYDYSGFPFNDLESESAMSPILSNGSKMMSPVEQKNHQFDYSRLTELEKAAMVSSTSPLSKTLKARHLSLISLGGAIGTGLFIGSGSMLSSAGPFGLLIIWVFVSLVIFATMASLAELATAFPLSGAFVTFNTLFVDSSFGFAMAWNYAMEWLITLPLELVAASITIDYWETNVNPAVFVAVFYVVIVVINLFGVKGYGEVESFLSLIKILAVIGFLILSIILVCGGGGHTFIGGSNWHSPKGGMFNSVEPFKQCCSILVSTAFAYSGVELFGLASCETANPRESIPKAMKQVFWRLLVFYIGSIIMIGLLVSYKSSELIGNNSKASNVGVNINISPFVIAVKNAQIPALPSIINILIIITVLSVGNASVYGSSRTLAALGALKQAPPIFNYIDRKGRPIVALCVQFVFGLLCFLVALPGPNQTIDAFNWLLSLSGLAALFTYISICICHLRFRRALSIRARIAEEELVYTSRTIYSWYAIIALIVIIGLQFWAALFPPGNEGKADVKGFFQIYLGLAFCIVCYVGHKIYAKFFLNIPFSKFYLTAEEIDVDTGRREIDLDVLKEEIAEKKDTLSRKPLYYRLYNFFC
ncbi:uncharacterized protein PRCAT00002397001 [Priceomyces carsonii]|uniref:uncharacterized protein n=1 Tax=Priceomyces carsonii TaxID=28549 RepID=UPI002EDA8716|nr:unnamed protein product [Priceomyces carsonii]